MTAIQKETVQITSNNIEENVKKWLEHFEIGMRKVSNPDTYFSYEVRGANNDPITISHPKAFNNYITFQAVLIVSQPHKDVLDKLKNEQVAQLALEVHLEMAKFKIENALNFPLKSLSLNNVYLQKRILITNSLTEDSFIERLNEVIFALAVARDITVLGLDRLAKENAIPRVQ